MDGKPWQKEPFRLVEKNDRLYGRGTADMKSFCAIALAMVPKFVARRLHLRAGQHRAGPSTRRVHQASQVRACEAFMRRLLNEVSMD